MYGRDILMTDTGDGLRGHDADRLTKIARIEQACDVKDVVGLSSLAMGEHGLVNDQLRRRACSTFSLPLL